jgi:signal transduction histidine kinase
LVGASPQRPVEQLEFAALQTDDARLLLPPTRIDGERGAEHLSETIAQRLSDRPEPLDFQAEVSGIFEELMINAIQHSPSDRPRGRSRAQQRLNQSHAMLEHSECCTHGLFSICVRDTGGGIRSSLRNSHSKTNKELSNAANAIKYATERGTTGTQDERGIGLSHVKAVTAAHGGCLFITSGPGAVLSGNGLLKEIAKELSPIHGTLSFAALFVPDLK